MKTLKIYLWQLIIWSTICSTQLKFNVHSRLEQTDEIKNITFNRKLIKGFNNNNNINNNHYLKLKQERKRDSWFDDYHTYEEIKNWCNELSLKSEYIKFIPSIGKSYEGREIFAIHLTKPKRIPKKVIYVQSLIHAREWITTTTLQYFINFILQKLPYDKHIQDILEQVQIVAIPIVNPDGYSYTWTHDRMWRKNRVPYHNGTGVDLNRNFPFGWGGLGSSSNPNSVWHRGKAPLSEPETKAIVQYYKKLNNVIGAIDLHSYSQLILRPYGMTYSKSQHEQQHYYLGERMKQSIYSVNKTNYINERFIDLYPASGLATDWFYSSTNTTYSFTIELSPEIGNPMKFILPKEWIPKVGKDLIPALLSFIQGALNNPLN